MEKVTAAESFRTRALEAMESAKDALSNGHLETAVSRSYYACYYAIHSKLEEMGEIAGSHKQTGILFRKFFIKTGLMDQKFSVTLRELSEWRMDVDYAPSPEIDKTLANRLVKKADDFVTNLLSKPYGV